MLYNKHDTKSFGGRCKVPRRVMLRIEMMVAAFCRQLLL